MSPIGTGNEDLVGGVQRHWPLRAGDQVTFPEYVNEAPRLMAQEDGEYRPAYQDPPIVGTVKVVTPDGSGLPGSYAHVNFPGVGIRVLGADELTRVEA